MIPGSPMCLLCIMWSPHVVTVHYLKIDILQICCVSILPICIIFACCNGCVSSLQTIIFLHVVNVLYIQSPNCIILAS